MNRVKRICMLILLTVGFIGTISTQARPRAKRVVILALDGISVPGFIQAQTPHLDTLLAEGALSTDTRVVMPSVTLSNWTRHPQTIQTDRTQQYCQYGCYYPVSLQGETAQSLDR